MVLRWNLEAIMGKSKISNVTQAHYLIKPELALSAAVIAVLPSITAAFYFDRSSPLQVNKTGEYFGMAEIEVKHKKSLR
jgi:hypothetical protein